MPSATLITPSQRENNRSFWNRRRETALEEFQFSRSNRAQGLEQAPQGFAKGAVSEAWHLALIDRKEEAHDCAHFALQATKVAIERGQFAPFFASAALRDPYLKRLNDLSGRMNCLRIQFAARWILEGAPPLELLAEAVEIWRPAREEKPQWYSEADVLRDCVVAEQWEDALWMARLSARRSRLRLQAANEYIRAPSGEVATLAVLAEVAQGSPDLKGQVLAERAVEKWCAKSLDWPRNTVGLSVRERVEWFYLWHRHFSPSVPALPEMLRDIRGE